MLKQTLCKLGLGMLAAAGVWLVASCSTPMRAAPEPAENQAAPVAVECSRPERGTIVRSIEMAASLEPYQEAVLYAKVSGYLQSIRVDRGDRVRQGDLLARLEIPEMDDEIRHVEAQLSQAEADVQRARAEIRLQEVTAKRLEAILAEEPGATTPQEVDLAQEKLSVAQAAAAAAAARVEVIRAERGRLETMLDYGTITAPFDGIVTERYVDPGALVTAGTQSRPAPILKLVQASSLRLMVDVPDTEVSFVEVGKPARLRVDALPDREFQGQVSRFSRALDPRSRTMRTEVLIPNPDGALAPGMFGRISLDLERRENVMTLAPSMVHFQKQKAFVFLAQDGVARRVEVVPGADDGNKIEITAGLSGREAVIAQASEAIADGTPIRIMNEGPQ